MELKKNYGSRIKQLIKYNNTSVYKISKETNIPSTVLYKWTRGEVKKPRWEYINKLLCRFNIPLEELNGYESSIHFLVVDQTPNYQNKYSFDYYTDANFFAKKMFELVNSVKPEEHHIYVTTGDIKDTIDYKASLKKSVFFDSSLI